MATWPGCDGPQSMKIPIVGAPGKLDTDTLGHSPVPDRRRRDEP
jgi:hypothetical protein